MVAFFKVKQMQAVFELSNVSQQWKPPFKKEVESKEVAVEEENYFGRFDGTEEFVFKLLKVEDGKALVQFNEKFTLKGHEHPRNRQIWLEKNDPVSFTHLWGNDGQTKKLVLKGILD